MRMYYMNRIIIVVLIYHHHLQSLRFRQQHRRLEQRLINFHRYFDRHEPPQPPAPIYFSGLFIVECIESLFAFGVVVQSCSSQCTPRHRHRIKDPTVTVLGQLQLKLDRLQATFNHCNHMEIINKNNVD